MDLAAIRARYEAAIPEPWTLRREDDGGPDVDVMSGKTVIASMGDFYPEAEFVAHARTDLPAVVEALEEARTLMKAARKNHVCNCPDCAAIDAFDAAITKEAP